MENQIKAIKALQVLQADFEHDDMPIEAKQVAGMIDSLIQTALMVGGYPGLRDAGIYVCSECNCIFQPWSDDHSDVCECCGGPDEMLIDAAYEYDHRG